MYQEWLLTYMGHGNNSYRQHLPFVVIASSVIQHKKVKKLSHKMSWRLREGVECLDCILILVFGEISNFIKIRPVETQLFHADGQT